MTDYAKQVADLVQKHAVAKATVHRLSHNFAELCEQLRVHQEAQRIVQHLASEVQNQVHGRISQIVSRCLTAVFVEDPYEFQIEFEIKRGKTEAKLQFVRDGVVVDPLTASGGGVVDVASFALRLAALVLTKPPRRKLLVLDEPFRFVSADYRDRVRQLLLRLSEELGLQIIMVTHDPALQVGNVVEIE